MSFDLYLVPTSGFLDWNDDEWEAFFDADPDSFELGRARYVGLVLDAVADNLEGGRLGSRFPLFARINTEERVGWYHDEIGQLGAEIQSIRGGLAALPVSRSTLGVESDEELEAWVRGPWPRDAALPPASVDELLRYFFEGFGAMLKRASATGQGLYVSY